MRILVRSAALLFTVAVAYVPAAAAQIRSAPIADVHYTVTFDSNSAANRTIHADMTFTTAGADPVILSLPAWSPGSYELDNFARYVVGFSAREDSDALDWDKVDYDTWRVRPRRAGQVTVGLDYRADTLDVGMEWAADDFVFFNGTNLFLYPEGRGYDFPATMSIRTEPGWLVATGMTPAGVSHQYRADSYHQLVDMPTFIGRFDLDSARVQGRWYRLATYPAGVLAGDARAATWDAIHKMAPPMSAVWGETPWQTYTVEMVFPEGFGGGSALEHENSHLGVYTRFLIGTPILASVVAHETFHAWNVKRLRPAQMVPYDYGRAEPTELLWVSEGITDYYADLALVRGGIVADSGFYATTSGKINQVIQTPPVALEDASLSTWIQPVDGTAYIYYPKGSLAGFLLDIQIRDASDNRASLDDVMRSLYESTYKHGKGFTTAEWWQAVSRAAGGRSFAEFAERYIDGREPFPYTTVLPLAGLRLVVDSTRAARIGISTGPSPDSTGVPVTQVLPGTSAQAAGMMAGDLLTRVGDVEITDGNSFQAFRDHYADMPAGTPLDYVVRRDGADVTLHADLRFAFNVQTRLEEDPNASPKAVRVRNGILHGTTGR